MNNTKLLSGHLAMFFSTLFFGLNIPVLKFLMPEWLSGVDATFFRVVGATILFWIVSLFEKNDKIEKGDRLLILFSGMFGLFFFLYLFNLGVEYSSPIDISIIMTTPPVLVVIFSSILFKTKISKLKILGVIVSLAGALMLILMGHGEGGTRSLKGNIFGVLSAISYACYLISIKKTSAKYKPITLLRWTFLSCSIMTIPFTLMQVEVAPIWHNAPTEPILLLASVILFPTFISYLLIPIAVKRIGHELVSMYQYLIPVVATAAAVIMKLDKLHWDQPIAAVIIVLGVYITSIANKRMINT